MPKKKAKSNRKLPPVLHIFCEGEKTEPNYLNGYLKLAHPGNRRMKVVKVEKTNKNTPIQLVEAAISAKNSNQTPLVDEFWVVYDRESIAKYSDYLHEKAYQSAKANSVNIALTNVCFEVWLLLHLQFSTAPYSSYNDLMSNSNLKSKLKERGVTQYEKSDINLFKTLSCNSGIGNARDRAEKMNNSVINAASQGNTKPYKLNPYTDMHKLLDAIDKFSKAM